MTRDELEAALSRWSQAGLLSDVQVQSIRSLEGRAGHLAANSGPATEPPAAEPEPAVGPEPELASEPRLGRSGAYTPGERNGEQLPPRPGRRSYAVAPPPPPGHAAPAPAAAYRPAPAPAPRRSLASGPIVDMDFLPRQASLDARLLGIILAILAAMALAWGLFAVAVDFLVGPHALGLTEALDVLHLLAAFLGLLGGAQMASGHPDGRRTALASLGLSIAASLPLGLDRLVHGGTILFVLAWLILAVLVLNSRFGRAVSRRVA